MIIRQTRAVALASALALSTLSMSPALAQTAQGGAASGISRGDLSVGTSSSGQATTTPDGRAVGVTGSADAAAANGGQVATDTAARLNERRAMQSSTATARDEDERATSRSRTIVTPNDMVRSRSMTRYKERGAPPVRETTTTVTRPDGTTTTK